MGSRMSDNDPHTLKQKLFAVRQLSAQMKQPLPVRLTNALFSDYLQLLDVDLTQLEIAPLDLVPDFSDVADQDNPSKKQRVGKLKQDKQKSTSSVAKSQSSSPQVLTRDQSYPIYSLRRDKTQGVVDPKQDKHPKRDDTRNGDHPSSANQNGNPVTLHHAPYQKWLDEQTFQALEQLNGSDQLSMGYSPEVDKLKSENMGFLSEVSSTTSSESVPSNRSMSSGESHKLRRLPQALDSLNQLADAVMKDQSLQKRQRGESKNLSLRHQRHTQTAPFAQDTAGQHKQLPFDTPVNSSFPMPDIPLTEESPDSNSPMIGHSNAESGKQSILDVNPEVLAELVNDVLMRQARRYGVDLS